jgi:hypothetical protein
MTQQKYFKITIPNQFVTKIILYLVRTKMRKVTFRMYFFEINDPKRKRSREDVNNDMPKVSYLTTGSTILLAAVFDVYTRIVDFIKSEFLA